MSSSNLKIAQPYAEAFLELSSKGSLETVINDLNCLSSAITDSSDLRKFLSNPLIKSENKKVLIKTVFSDKIDPKTLRLLLVLCDRGRISYLDSIITKSLELAYKAASIEIVVVTAASAFTNSQQDILVAKLKTMTGASQIKLDIKLESNLIGGFVVQVGSKIIDVSIQGQLRQLSSHLGASLV
jgi:F-type H+-transporting ATPase subunit delta